MNTVYKVVTIDEDGNYRSSCPPSLFPKANLYYRFNEVTKAYFPNSLLYIFKNLEEAISFCGFLRNSEFVILECVTEDEIVDNNFICFVDADKFWANKYVEGFYIHKSPRNTYGVKSLIPIRVV